MTFGERNSSAFLRPEEYLRLPGVTVVGMLFERCSRPATATLFLGPWIYGFGKGSGGVAFPVFFLGGVVILRDNASDNAKT